MTFKKILIGMQDGLRTGSLVFLLVGLFSGKTFLLTPSSILSVLLVSALIGVASYIFDATDRLPFPFLLFCHFVVTATIVCLAMICNDWGSMLFGWFFWLNFILIYLLVWFLVSIDSMIKTKKINEALKNRRKH